MTDYQLDFEGGGVLGGLDAYELVITYTMVVFDLKAKQVLSLKDGEGYVITFTALQSNYDDDSPASETSVETFKFDS